MEMGNWPNCERFPQSAGHIKLAAEFELIESVNHLMECVVANEWESLACDL